MANRRLGDLSPLTIRMAVRPHAIDLRLFCPAQPGIGLASTGRALQPLMILQFCTSAGAAPNVSPATMQNKMLTT